MELLANDKVEQLLCLLCGLSLAVWFKNGCLSLILTPEQWQDSWMVFWAMPRATQNLVLALDHCSPGWWPDA
jgi:hypothetical protein